MLEFVASLQLGDAQCRLRFQISIRWWLNSSVRARRLNRLRPQPHRLGQLDTVLALVDSTSLQAMLFVHQDDTRLLARERK
jgi:hypothetical protein